MSEDQDKDKKISSLRGLLFQSKNKIQELKGQLEQKEKQTIQIRKGFDKKIKMLESESENIIKQYQERLLRYQKSLEDSDNVVQKHQKNAQHSSKSFDQIMKKISNIYNMTTKTFGAVSSAKDNSEAVEQLCQIDRIKEYSEWIDKNNSSSDMELIVSIIVSIIKSYQHSITKRRQQRLMFLKKESQLQKLVDEEKNKVRKAYEQNENGMNKMKQLQQQYEKEIEFHEKNQNKVQQEKISNQFIKQLLLKMMAGSKQASSMALGVLSKVLNLSPIEVEICTKKIK